MVHCSDTHWIFRMPCVEARQLYLVGEFNQWCTTATPMRQVQPRVWQVDICLPPGRYRFRYVTDDGRWYTDFAAFGVERNAYDQWDSVVCVPDVEVSGPNTGRQGAVLTRNQMGQLESLMALLWCLVNSKGDRSCDKESDLYVDPHRMKLSDREHAMVGRYHSSTVREPKRKTRPEGLDEGVGALGRTVLVD